MTVLVPDKSSTIFTKQKSFPIDQNNLAYNPGPVSPPGGDGSPLASGFLYKAVPHLHVMMGAGISNLGLLGNSSCGQNHSLATEDGVHALLGQR